MLRGLLVLTALLAFSTIAAQNSHDKIIIARYISAINLYDSMYQALDKACDTSFSLSNSQIEEIDTLTREKSGIGYTEFNRTMGDPEFIKSVVDKNLINMLVELGGCDVAALNEWHEAVSVDFDNNLLALRSSKSNSTN
jgi:hypothetical protein